MISPGRYDFPLPLLNINSLPWLEFTPTQNVYKDRRDMPRRQLSLWVYFSPLTHASSEPGFTHPATGYNFTSNSASFNARRELLKEWADIPYLFFDIQVWLYASFTLNYTNDTKKKK